MDAMELKEKWERMNNPTCPADYGLSVNEAELRLFPEGRKILCNIRRKIQGERNFLRKHMKNFGVSSAKTINKIALDILLREG